MELTKWYLSTIDGNAHRTAQAYGMGLEIAEFCTASNIDERLEETTAAVRKKLTGIASRILHAPFSELSPCAVDPKIREVARLRYRQAIALAQSFGCEKIVIHSGYHPLTYYPVWYTEQSILFWKEFLREVPKDMTLLLENVFEEESAMLLAVLKAVDDPRLRLCLDVGHVHAYAKEPVMEWLQNSAPWIHHFHLHNNDQSCDSHSALNEGTIPMRELIRRAMQLCPDATYTLEVLQAEASVRWLCENGL